MHTRTYRKAKEDEEEAVDSAALHQEATDSVCGFESVVEPSPQRERERERRRGRRIVLRERPGESRRGGSRARG